LAKRQFEEAAEILEKDYRNRFDDFLRDKFGDKSLVRPVRKGAVHHLPRIARGPVLTTNFDHVLEAAFEAAGAPFDNNRVFPGSRIHEASRAIQLKERCLLKLHGDYADLASRVLTIREYAREYGSLDPRRVNFDRPLPSVLAQALGAGPLLFLGCSLEGDFTTSVIARLAETLTGTIHFALLPEEALTQDRSRQLDSWNIRPLYFPAGRFEKIEQFLACAAEVVSPVKPTRWLAATLGCVLLLSSAGLTYRHFSRANVAVSSTTQTSVVHATVSTTTALALSSNSITAGTPLVLTATVKAGARPLTTGQVKFCDATAEHCTDIHLLGSAQLTSAGTAALKFVPGIGSHSYKAVFVGTTSNGASYSAPLKLNVRGKYPTTTTITQSASKGTYTLTATVVGDVGRSGLAAPTGTVSFLDTSNGNAVVGKAMLRTGTARLNWTGSLTPTTASNSIFVAVGDFNGDGKADLAVANYGSDTLTILLGNGDGTFTPAKASPATGANPTFIAVGDFNGDGKADLAVANYGSDTLTILLGNGDGTFTPAKASPATGRTPFAIAVGDFNGDGKEDLAVANTGDNTVTILLGKGDGTFTSASVSPAGVNQPRSIAAGDFNGDGKTDLALANWASNTVTILLGNGDGTFTGTASPGTGSNPSFVAVGDFNGDGNADLAVADFGSNTVTILLGKGDGKFLPAITSPTTGDRPASVAVGDFNGDGKADLAVANYGSGTVTTLLGNGDGTFTAASSSPPTGALADSVAVGNFTGDGAAGLAVAKQYGNTVTVLLTTQASTATVSGISLFSAGTHKIEASYPGDGNYDLSVSGTTIIINSTANPVSSPVAGKYTSAEKLSGQETTEHSGEIIYKNGSKETFNYFWSNLAGDQLPFSESAEGMVRNSLSLPRVRVSSVSRIDFHTITKEERKALEQNSKDFSGIRKATVVFKDGTKKENIFLEAEGVKWRGPNVEGSFDDERIVAAVFE
jgi:hypothetical protein